MELSVNDPDAGKDQGQEEKGVIEDETIVDGITDSMDTSQCCTPGFPAPHQLPEPIQTQGHQVVMPSNHLIPCRPLLLLPSIFPSIRVFTNQSVQSAQLLSHVQLFATPWTVAHQASPVHHQLPELAQTHVH